MLFILKSGSQVWVTAWSPSLALRDWFGAVEMAGVPDPLCEGDFFFSQSQWIWLARWQYWLWTSTGAASVTKVHLFPMFVAVVFFIFVTWTSSFLLRQQFNHRCKHYSGAQRLFYNLYKPSETRKWKSSARPCFTITLLHIPTRAKPHKSTLKCYIRALECYLQ